jgi:hypothetical protein
MESPVITVRAGLMTPADNDVRWGVHPEEYVPAAVFFIACSVLGFGYAFEHYKKGCLALQ